LANTFQTNSLERFPQAIEKAQQALAACKNILDNPKKPTYNYSNQGFIVLLIAIGLGLAIAFGIILNIYKKFIFSRKN
jgi:preprotein translocase subunit Sss1